MKLVNNVDGFELWLHETCILSHSSQKPMIYIGRGEETISMHRGNFKIEDYLVKRQPLTRAVTVETCEGLEIEFDDILKVKVRVDGMLAQIDFQCEDTSVNRFWLRVEADAGEKIYGCGEQFSHFNLRGNNFPLWTSEPGKGRNKSTYITWRSDVENHGAGGDYYHTYYPQPTYVSSRHYYMHAESTAYADFDFRNERFHELQFWEVPRQIRIEAASTYEELLQKETEFFGRFPELPDWIYNGLIMGVQGGTERVLDLLCRTQEFDIPVAALWCQDWVGNRPTSFGKRVRWNWQWDEALYPGLPEKITELHKKGIRFMGYVNTFLMEGGSLFEEASAKGYLVQKQGGGDYLINFDEFNSGMPDLTNPGAYEWFKNVLKDDFIDFGLSGWMADFGEYLPADAVLYSGESAMTVHNQWPVLWAKCNYDAVNEAGKLGEVIYFMRAGGKGIQKYCPLFWAGDQSVDFTLDDGLPSAICATLSSGMTGCGITHSDIGGYTSVFDNCRTKEVFLRWAEMAAFTPFMRTHETNRPDTNFQYYEDDDTMRSFARLVKIYTTLKPYTKQLVAEASKIGIPVQRPLFLHYEDDEEAYHIKYEYLYGRDLLVAPVYEEHEDCHKVYLPNDRWIHLWSGRTYGQGWYDIPAPMGEPPVFYREKSSYQVLFEEIRVNYGEI